MCRLITAPSPDVGQKDVGVDHGDVCPLTGGGRGGSKTGVPFLRLHPSPEGVPVVPLALKQAGMEVQESRTHGGTRPTHVLPPPPFPHTGTGYRQSVPDSSVDCPSGVVQTH